MAVSPPMIKSSVITSAANNKVENKANKIPAPFTNPACISADAGVGAVIAESNQRWKGYIADWIMAAVMMHKAATKVMVCGRPFMAAAIPLTVKSPL